MQVLEDEEEVDYSGKKTVESMGAGPLLPVRGGTIGFLENALMPFMKKLKQYKHLDALQPSPTVDDRIVMPLHDAGEDGSCKLEGEPALDDNVDTVKVRDTISTFVRPKAWP